MALGSNIRLDCENDRGIPTFPASFSSKWTTVIDAGGMDAQDGLLAGTVVNPTTDITASDHHIFTRDKWMGTYIVPSLGYSVSATVTAGGTVVCFGRKDSTDRWMLLRTKDGSTALALTTDATDANDGTLAYTTPDLATDAFDMAGCNEFIFGVTVAHAVSAGSAAVAILQAKVI